MTILVGQLRDQAALSGVLNELYELHLPLLTVESLTEGEHPNPGIRLKEVRVPSWEGVMQIGLKSHFKPSNEQ